MHTGVISFCDRISFNIKSSDVKDQFLSEIEGKFKTRILQKHSFRLDAQNVAHLSQSNHWMSLRSNGNPYYLFFTKYEDVNQIIFIDKKVHPGYEKPRMILGKGCFPDALFKGTLLDGEMVKTLDKSWVFLINDMIAYEGVHLSNHAFHARLQLIYDFLVAYDPDPYFDVCKYQVKRYVPCAQKQFEALLELSSALPYTNRGMYFWPNSLRYKPKLYNFDDSLVKSVIRKVKDVTEFKTRDELSVPSSAPAQAPAQAPRMCTEGQRILWLRKTENPDVYDIFENENATAKIGIANVSKLSTSKQLRAVFKDQTIAITLAWVCEYNEGFKKWTPLYLHHSKCDHHTKF